MEREYEPDFDAGELARAAEPNTKLARTLALALLKQQKIARPEVDVEALAKCRGLVVAYVDVPGGLSGQLYPDLREIVVNRRGRSRARQRFTIAHELGHWEMQHFSLGELPPDTLGYAGSFEAEGASEGRSPVEREANTFAAELLMPSPWIRRIMKPLALGAPKKLAEEYGVSEEAMYYQLMRCGRLT